MFITFYHHWIIDKILSSWAAIINTSHLIASHSLMMTVMPFSAQSDTILIPDSVHPTLLIISDTYTLLNYPPRQTQVGDGCQESPGDLEEQHLMSVSSSDRHGTHSLLTGSWFIDEIFCWLLTPLRSDVPTNRLDKVYQIGDLAKIFRKSSVIANIGERCALLIFNQNRLSLWPEDLGCRKLIPRSAENWEPKRSLKSIFLISYLLEVYWTWFSSVPTTRILFYVKDCENGKIDIRLLFIRFEISQAY